MKTIQEFQLGALKKITLYIPEGSTVIGVMIRKGFPSLFVDVDENTSEKEARIFETFTSKEVVPTEEGSERKFIGTYEVYAGIIYFRVYERIN